MGRKFEAKFTWLYACMYSSLLHKLVTFSLNSIYFEPLNWGKRIYLAMFFFLFCKELDQSLPFNLFYRVFSYLSFLFVSNQTCLISRVAAFIERFCHASFTNQILGSMYFYLNKIKTFCQFFTKMTINTKKISRQF